jgi:hypothetical protein
MLSVECQLGAEKVDVLFNELAVSWDVSVILNAQV